MDIAINPGPQNFPTRAPLAGRQHKSTELSVFYANARSIVNKISSLALEIANGSYDIIVLTETHLDDTITDAEIFPNNYTVFRLDRRVNGRHGGGVLIAVREPIKAYPIDNQHSDSEFLFIDVIFLNHRKITIGVFYRPPNSSTKPLEDLQIVLQDLSTSELLLLGDFNLPDFDWTQNKAINTENYRILTDIMSDNFLTQLVNEPTRNHNILDLVFSSSVDMINNLIVGELFSDHNSITFKLLGQPYVQLKSLKTVYCYKKANWEHLKSLLSNTPWNCAFLQDDINYAWASWKDLLFNAVDVCIPKINAKKKSNAPWITRELILLCRMKKSLYKKAKRTQNDNIWAKYRQMNNTIKRKCNEARWNFLNNLASQLVEDENPKPFWNYVKSKRKGTNNLVSLKVGDSILTDDYSIACSMNSYFSSVFTLEHYDNFPTLDCVVDTKLESIQCSTAEVLKYLQNLNANKSPGPDHIPARILKICAAELAPSISRMLNISFSTGQVPDDWKIADISPIFKKGSKQSRENYRPISLTGIVCKIGEKIVRDRVLHFWQNINLLNANQFAYLKGRSTVAQLLTTIHDWAGSRNCNTPTDVIFLDLAKAFDSVPHERLLLKLYKNGIDGCLLDWIRHYLTGRKQRVLIRGTCSEWSPVTSGTPQGTVLGPILFLLYINDITDCITSKVKIYADDTKIYRVITDPTADIPALQSDLNNLTHWANTWQLRFNTDKCEGMRVTHSRDKSSTSYTLGTTQLKDVTNFKDLGVTVTRNLSWSEHVHITVNKANKILGTIKRTVGTANVVIFSKLYMSLVRPILEYATPVWCPYLVKDIHAIEQVQRRASRLALRQKKGDMSYEDRCTLLGWPKLSLRREYISLIECYKIVFGLSHLQFDDFFEKNQTKVNKSKPRIQTIL